MEFFAGSGWSHWPGPENWQLKYGTTDAPSSGWATWLTNIGELVANQVTTYEYDYEYPFKEELVNEATPKDDNWNTNYATSVDKALYLTWQEYKACIDEGYNCYALSAGTKSVYTWGPSFMNYLANGKSISFDQIQKDILYLVDSGSFVVDEIGKTDDYDFDFINDIGKLKLTVGGENLDADKLADNKYGFGKQDDGSYQFILTYYKDGTEVEGISYGECFVWDINVPVTIDKQVQLTYSVKLTNPKTAAGTYGEYDRDGSQGKDALYTNNSAMLYPTNSAGDKGGIEAFNKPTVSYTVAAQGDPSRTTDGSDITDEEAATEDAVKTGDTLSMMMLVALILAAAGGAVVLITRKRRII